MDVYEPTMRWICADFMVEMKLRMKIENEGGAQNSDGE